MNSPGRGSDRRAKTPKVCVFEVARGSQVGHSILRWPTGQLRATPRFSGVSSEMAKMATCLHPSSSPAWTRAWSIRLFLSSLHLQFSSGRFLLVTPALVLETPMPITLACPCGKPLRVGDQHAGKLVKCPVCGATQRAGPPAVEAPVAAPKPPACPSRRTTSRIEDDVAQPCLPSLLRPPCRRSRLRSPPRSHHPAGLDHHRQAKKTKKRKKKSVAGEDDDSYLDRSARRPGERAPRRAYIVVGVLILIGVRIIYLSTGRP